MIKDTDLRPYWGAYFNLARHNLFTTLKFINDSVGVGGGIDYDEAQIWKMSILNKKLSPEEEAHARSLFFLHFPFLKYLAFDKEDLTIPFAQVRKRIKSFANVISWWRNIYSHSRGQEKTDKEEYKYLREDEETICQFLSFVTTVSARIIKERYSSRNESQKGMLSEDSMVFLTRDRYKPSRTPDGKRTMILAKTHFTYPGERGRALNDGSNPERLSMFGKIQMVCLFLEKKYITEFLSQIHFLSDFSDDAKTPLLSQRRLVLETMSALRIRLPENKLHADRNETQVALDIIGELKKCPSEIFELLSAKDKAEFTIQASNGDTVLLRRSSDRFVPLALSFLDTTNAFQKLRFQVNAGVFRYLYKENKYCIDGQGRIRVLQEPLNGFGRIQEVERKRSSENREIWKNYKILGYEDSPRNDASCLPYISDVHTRYIIDGDNIGMRLDGDYLPVITPREDGVHYNVPCLKADCTISRFDLPALLFYHMIWLRDKRDRPSAESLISKAVSSYRKFFSDIAEGKLLPVSSSGSEEEMEKRISVSYGIPLKGLPEKIRDYIFRKKDDVRRFEKYKEALLRDMKEDTERRLARIKEQKQTVEIDLDSSKRSDNKPGKKGYVQIKPGNLASFLAKDIVFFQEGTNKLTGLNYAVMQAAIATFSSNNPSSKNELMNVFKKAGLIASDGSAGTHPFLFKAMSGLLVSRTLDLYIDYLKAKLQYLSATVPDSAAFLHVERTRWAQRDDAYYKGLAKRYLERPIALTGSIFEEPVQDILRGLNNPDITKELDSKHCNMAYMIQLYQTHILDDWPQSFYGLSEGDMVHDNNYRLYQLIRKYNKETKEIIRKLQPDSVYCKTLTEVVKWAEKHPEGTEKKGSVKKGAISSIPASEMIRSAYNEMMDTERLIRRLATQDTVLFMAASSILKRIWGLPAEDNSMKLGEINDLLDRKLQRVVKTIKFGWKDSTDNSVPLGYKDVSVEVENIPVKDYGDIYKLINDRRVASLVHHLNINWVKADELQKELESYDNRRVGVFKDLFEYENRVLDSAESVPMSPDFETVQELDSLHTPEEKFASKIIRNGFCHNFYPTKIGRNRDIKSVIIYDEDIPLVADSMADKISKLNKGKKE